MSGQPQRGDRVRIVAPWPPDGRTTDVGAVGPLQWTPLGDLDFWSVYLPSGGIALASAVERVEGEPDA